MDPSIEDMGVPEFARIEIRLEGANLQTIANQLSLLAQKLKNITAEPSTLIAYRHIRATSAKLRGSN